MVAKVPAWREKKNYNGEHGRDCCLDLTTPRLMMEYRGEQPVAPAAAACAFQSFVDHAHCQWGGAGLCTGCGTAVVKELQVRFEIRLPQ